MPVEVAVHLRLLNLRFEQLDLLLEMFVLALLLLDSLLRHGVLEVQILHGVALLNDRIDD